MYKILKSLHYLSLLASEGLMETLLSEPERFSASLSTFYYDQSFLRHLQQFAPTLLEMKRYMLVPDFHVIMICKNTTVSLE